MAWLGRARLGMVRPGLLRSGLARQGEEFNSMEKQCGIRTGVNPIYAAKARWVEDRMIRFLDRRLAARPGAASRGPARLGQAGLGVAGQGKAWGRRGKD
jgi:hypothetical protein